MAPTGGKGSSRSPGVREPGGRGVRLPRGLEFVRVLGAGGFGYVVLAHDPNLRRDVAVKYVYGGAHAGDALDRLLREGRALATLRSRAVVPVYEAVRVSDDVALVMEYVAGGDLEHWLQTTRLTADQRLQLLRQLAVALETVHEAGIVHRDLKPANVLITPEGVVKIADFGLARFMSDASAYRTDAGVSTYTPHYGAPEQQADPDHETPRIDWFSFAAVAYRVMLQELPPLHVDPAGERPGAAIFAAGLALDPSERVAPVELVRLLENVDPARWPVLSTVGDPSADSTGKAVETHRAGTAGGAHRQPGPGVDAGVGQSGSDTADSTTDARAGRSDPVGTEGLEWTPVYQPPVYRPPRRRPVSWSSQAIGLVLGLLTGALVALAIFVLR